MAQVFYPLEKLVALQVLFKIQAVFKNKLYAKLDSKNGVMISFLDHFGPLQSVISVGVALWMFFQGTNSTSQWGCGLHF